MRALLAVALLFALPATVAAQAPNELPVGEAHGVRLVNRHGGYVLIFSRSASKLRKQINSPYAWIACSDLGDDPFVGVGSGNLDIPPRGRVVHTGFHVGGADFCRIYLRAHTVRRDGSRHRVERTVLFSIPITQAGAVYLDEEQKTATMFTVSLIERLSRPKAAPDVALTYTQLVQVVPRFGKSLVALAGPGDSPPPRKLGYYSDGAEHTALVIISAAGRRLFIEQAADKVLSTNVADYLFGDPL